MRVPVNVQQVLAAIPAFGFSCSDDGVPLEWPPPSFYPPLGFLPWSLFEVGNGDVYGYYWPIGREDSPPIVCETYHDGWELEPIASSLEGLLRLKLASRNHHREDAIQLGRLLGIDVNKISPTAKLDAGSALALDDSSPRFLTIAGHQLAEENQIDLAQRYYLKALDLVPEYGSASFGLARVYRRKRDLQAAIQCMLDVLIAPRCFGGDKKMCLRWIQQLPDTAFFDANDPIWSHRHQLTLASGVKQNNDFLVYEELIEAYLNKREGNRAIRLRIMVGEFMATETLAFRERYNYTEARHIELLIDNLDRAGLSSRLVALKRI